MNFEKFFEKFELFADAPDAVATLRGLVLQLAVQGKLMPQARSDEPAAALLASVQSERAKLVAARKIKARSSLPVGQAEQPYDLPASWVWARLLDVGYELGQKIPDTRFTYIDVGGIDSDTGRISDRVEVLEAHEAPSRARKLITRGTVIYSTVRPYLRNIAIVDRDFYPNPIASTAFGILHPFQGVDNRYLFYWLRSEPFTAYVQSGMKGMAYPAINDEKFYSGYIALPPLAEQKRIVAKVDELMALCDRLEAQQQERVERHTVLARAALARFADAPTPANLELLFHKSYEIDPADLRKSILTLAIQGKLVPQNLDEEPAEEIGARVVEECAPVDVAELPWSVPLSWKWVRLGVIADIKHGYAFSSRSFTSKPTRYVLTTPGNFYESGGFRDRGANTKYFNGEVPPSFVFNPGDLIIPMTEQAAGLLGSPAFIPCDGKTYLHNQRLGKLEFYTDDVSPDFVFWFFNSEFFRGELARTCTGMKVRHTSPKRILKVPIPLPPLAEQRRIVAKVAEAMALVDRLEAQLATARTTAASLLEAAVAELTTANTTAPVANDIVEKQAVESSPAKQPNRHFARAVLSAEIVDRLHNEPTFGRVKHQKIFHLCEHIAQVADVGGQYHREAAGPLDGKLIHSNEAELKKQQWYTTAKREKYGHCYLPLAKAGGHRQYAESFWPQQIAKIRELIELMRSWDTDQCEIFSTAYAAWNDLLLRGQQPATDEAILHEILDDWHPDKRRFPRKRWLTALEWMRDKDFVPTAFGQPTVKARPKTGIKHRTPRG